jgi:hypothetical protein
VLMSKMSSGELSPLLHLWICRSRVWRTYCLEMRNEVESRAMKRVWQRTRAGVSIILYIRAPINIYGGIIGNFGLGRS